jgi:hypothetical protein
MKVRGEEKPEKALMIADCKEKVRRGLRLYFGGLASDFTEFGAC